jgi:secreted trypsin-like serine protease
MREISKLVFICLFPLFLASCGKGGEKITGKEEKECKLSSLSSNRVLGGCKVKDADNIPGANSSVLIQTESGKCTGTFIQSKVILTAAHCFSQKDTSVSIKVVKDYETLVSVNSLPIKQQVSINPVYSKTDLFGDLALIYTNKSATEMGAQVAKITSKAQTNEAVFFVGFGINTDDRETETKGIIKRWGRAVTKSLINSTNISPEFSIFLTPFDSILKMMKETGEDPDLNNINNLNDFKKYLSINENADYSTPISTFVYSEGTENESGLCSGDSGGAIYVKRNNEYAAVGIATAVVAVLNDEKVKCSNKKSISTLIAAYSDFINKDLKQRGLQKLEFLD